jgi:outer membrane protein OmpA-like peptidoglycan-associated protein/tetratricopeptide (TPR) repeat protein
LKLTGISHPFFVVSSAFFVLCSFENLKAQQRNAFFVKADEMLASNKYDEATRLYKEGLRTDPEDLAAQYNCGLSLFKAGKKSTSLSYFRTVYLANPHQDKFLLKYLGRAYQLNYKFDSAIAVFKEYEKHLHKHEKEQQVLEKEIIDKRIVECLSAKELIKNPQKVTIKNLGEEVNSVFDDYSPTISADEKTLMFTSRRDHVASSDNNFSKKEQTYFEEILLSDWTDSTWGPAHSIGENVNGKRHDASVSVSPDGQRLIVYKSTPQTKGDLYYSQLVDSVWNDPVKFGGEINSTHFEPSAIINSAENSLIFSSDRPGGFGGLDLYISTMLPTGQWGKPENLGATINTKYDEDAPFLQADEKTLHFSSSGHNSMGGYDIFTTLFDVKKKSWSIPQNAGHPINTPDDDIYFSWNNSGTHAYFSSVREGGHGGQDIYMVEIPTNDPAIVVVKGVVSDKITNTPLGSMLKVTVYSLDSNKVVGFYNSSHATGSYIFTVPHDDTYGMQVEAEGYLLHSENFTVPKSQDLTELPKHIGLQPIQEGNKVVLNNLFFEYKKSTLRPESKMELKAIHDFMVSNPQLSIEIGGHTDSIGSNKYNLALSEARALAVKKYLEKLGVEAKRLSSKGYSFSNPLASNQTEEGRKLNRRTEFLVLTYKP